METQHLVWAIFVTSISGFFFLLNMIIDSNKKIINELKSINTALVGDYDKKGIKTIVDQHEWHIQDIRKNCDKKHEVEKP